MTLNHTQNYQGHMRLWKEDQIFPHGTFFNLSEGICLHINFRRVGWAASSLTCRMTESRLHRLGCCPLFRGRGGGRLQETRETSRHTTWAGSRESALSLRWLRSRKGDVSCRMETTRPDHRFLLHVPKPECDLSEIPVATAALILLPGRSRGAREQVNKLRRTKPPALRRVLL